MSKYRFEQIVFNSTEKKKPTEEDKYTYLGLEHLDSGSLHVTRYGSDVAPIGEKLIMREGDVLFGKRRAYQKKVAVAPFDGIFSAHGMVLRPKEEVIDKHFFPLFISSDYFLDAAIKISVGSLSPTINWSDLKELEFELPDLDKQRELAKVLWAIDATKKSYQKLLLKTDELIISQFIKQFSILDTVPLKEIANISSGQSSPYDEEFSDDGTPFIKAGNLEGLKLGKYTENSCNKVNQATIQKRKLKLKQPGTVLIAKSGMSCLSGHVYALKQPAYVVSHLACIEPIGEKGVTDFIRFFFTTYGTKDLIKDPSYPSIQLGQLSEMQIPNVSYSNQLKFAAIVQQSDKSKFELEQARAELTATYKKIIFENLGQSQ